MTSILLVDDHDIVRQGLRSLLEFAEEFTVVGEAANGRDAIALAENLKPDIIMLDLMMPEMDGLAAIRAIRSASSLSHIMVLTSSEDDELAFLVIEAGAQSFILKSMLGDELLATLRKIAAGEEVIHPLIARRILKMARTVREPQHDPFAQLTDREKEVLRELAGGRSNAKIALSLNISEKTVKSHISSVLSKLHLSGRTEAVAFAWREGLITPDSE